VGVVFLALACGIDSHRPGFHDDSEDLPAFSAARLGDPFGEGSALDFLEPEEREAVERSGMTGLNFRDDDPAAGSEAEPPDGADPDRRQDEGMLDKASKVGVALLSVGISLGAAAAPFFLF
jgi:hypothetical protein